MMRTRRRALWVAAAFSGLTLAAGLSLRTWEIPAPPGARCGNGDPVYLWRGLAHLPKEDPAHFWRKHKEDVTETGIVFAVVLAVGLTTYAIGRPRRRPVEAADYADGPTGAVPDGRDDPAR